MGDGGSQLMLGDLGEIALREGDFETARVFCTARRSTPPRRSKTRIGPAA